MSPNNPNEEVNYPPQTMDIFYVVSHGGSINQPVLVGRNHAQWLEKEGAVVLTREQYLEAEKERRKAAMYEANGGPAFCDKCGGPYGQCSCD